MRGALLWLVALSSLAGCGAETAARDLNELVVRDSVYLEPETLSPYTGQVVRAFPGDSTRIEIEGALLDGEWHGELVVRHPSGRVRYMGAFDHGERCGPWTENTLDEEPGTPYEQLIAEIETLGMYPPCPGGRAR